MCTILYIHVHAVTAPLHTFISQEMSATVNSLCGSLGTPCSLREVVSIVSGWRERHCSSERRRGVPGAQNTPLIRHVV